MGSQIFAFLLGAIATASCSTTTFWNLWAASGPASQTFVDPVWAWRSIWEICMQYTGDQYSCNREVSIFETPVYLVVLRAFMCTAMCLSFIACSTTLVGLECTRLLEDQPNRKRKLMIASGIMHAVASALTLISVAWYTAMVVREFFSFENQDNVFRYELGGAIYLGYTSAVISLAACLCCFCMPGPKEKKAAYIPAAYTGAGADFVLKAPRSEYV